MSIEIRGPQRREYLQDSGYRLVQSWPNVERGYVVLEDEEGNRELWHRNNHFAGYVVVIGNEGYEFIRSLQE